ncbi:MAG: exodeoxyribonuclease VII small subunit [Oscillospiraceae bacterium]|nr:exodeoxyribonuclease VII small subunit [Oscillospiraceae bacterium]
MPAAKKEKVTFEAALARLDEIVKTLERGQAPLDESLALFEEGTKLLGSCGKQLDEAEQKVVRLMKGPDGAPVELAFDEG